MFLENKYYKWYIKLTSKQDRKLECYTEKHHIIPRSLGGKDTKENLVGLTAREHFIAHLLLTKFTFGKVKQKMSFALWNMVNRDNGIRTSSRIHAIIREKHSKFLSESLSGENNPMFGKEHSKETRSKISKGGKGLKRTEETRQRISEANKGEKNSMYGVSKTKEQKEAASKRLKENNPMYNKEVVDKIKKAKEGTYNCFDVVEQKFVRICVNMYNLNKDRYKNNNSKEVKKFKEIRDVK